MRKRWPLWTGKKRPSTRASVADMRNRVASRAVNEEHKASPPSYQVHERFASPSEGIERTVRVYIPPAAPGSRFRVLVMQDGQNLFDRHNPGGLPSWGVDLALDRFAAQGSGLPWLLVAVEHRGNERLADYSPWPDPRVPVEARGQEYAAFVAERLIPWARASLPVVEGPEHTAVAGSSLGGLISLYVAWRYPDVVGRVAAFSPSVMWSSRQLFRYWSRHPGVFQRVYLDAGSREVFDAGDFSLDYGAAAVEFHAHLSAVGYPASELRLVRDPRGKHGESDWRRRLPAALRWLSAG